MGELRKDYLMNRWVIIEPERSKRPHEYTEKAVKVKSGIDYFSPDNEKSTPQETYRYPSKGKWQIRAFLNKFPAVKNEGDYNIHYESSINQNGLLLNYILRHPCRWHYAGLLPNRNRSLHRRH